MKHSADHYNEFFYRADRRNATTPTTELVAFSQLTELSQSSASTNPICIPVVPIVAESREATGHVATARSLGIQAI